MNMNDYISLRDYPSQLETYEWKQKRIEILERDKYRCQICGKGKSTVLYNPSSDRDSDISIGIDYSYSTISIDDILFTHFSVQDFIDIISAKNLSLTPTDYVVSSNDILGVLAEPHTNEFPVNCEDVEINLVRHPTGMLYFIVNREEDNLSNIKLHTPYFIDHPISLNVHHKHYIIGHKAWEYDDEDLVTLCNECHTKVHHAIGAPVYLHKNGYMKEVPLTPCFRCEGTGYFPEYKHVENGICFRCRGARFEELRPYVK